MNVKRRIGGVPMTKPQPPVKNLKDIMKKWQGIKDEIRDTECSGETFEFLSEWVSPETGTAQHSLWRGCERIVKLCHEINEQINLSYPHPIPDVFTTGAEKVLFLFPPLGNDYCKKCLRNPENDPYCKSCNIPKGNPVELRAQEQKK